MELKEISEAIMKGTTTVGIVCSDGVVMGADTRATMDTFIASDQTVKVYKVDEGLGMTIAGIVGDCSYLVKLLRVQNEFYKMNEGRPMSPGAATSLLSIILQENKYAPYIVELIVGGLNNGEPEIYSIDAFGGAVKDTKFISTGSGSLTALGYLESIYNQSFTSQDGVKHVAKALQMAMRRDAATGGNVKIVAITKKGFKEYTKEEIEKLTK